MNRLGNIEKNYKMTSGERLAKSKSLSESWKSRPDYIADIKDLHPRIYNVWRGIRFTEKGKRAGCCPEWEDFRKFYEDVEPTYKDGLLFRRKNTLEPFSPDNFIWVTSEEAKTMLDCVMLEYNGKVMSLKQWSVEASVSFYGIKNRYYKHRDSLTTEEIIYGKRTKRNSKTPKDPLENERAKASKMISSYKFKDKKHGFDKECDLTIDWMIEKIFHSKCVYCGDTHRLGCDRIDNNKAHTMDNVVPCCVECNSARNNFFSFEEMKVLGATIREIKNKR